MMIKRSTPAAPPQKEETERKKEIRRGHATSAVLRPAASVRERMTRHTRTRARSLARSLARTRTTSTMSYTYTNTYTNTDTNTNTNTYTDTDTDTNTNTNTYTDTDTNTNTNTNTYTYTYTYTYTNIDTNTDTNTNTNTNVKRFRPLMHSLATFSTPMSSTSEAFPPLLLALAAKMTAPVPTEQRPERKTLLEFYRIEEIWLSSVRHTGFVVVFLRMLFGDDGDECSDSSREWEEEEEEEGRKEEWMNGWMRGLID
eukprot:3790065-Rhodomonas_salina.1